MRTPLVVGNWKMNTSADEARSLSAATAAAAAEHAGAVDVGVAPPAIWLERVNAEAGDSLQVFGQNASQHAKGAHTGEISVPMLVDATIGGVILGHSERRHVYGETNAVIGAKVLAAQNAGLHVILCVGETLEEREADATWRVVSEQLTGGLTPDVTAESLTIAYEPVWAIGTGKTATAEQAQAVHAQIRGWLADRFSPEAAERIRIQYGGSVKPSNAAELLAMEDIDGALVGGASLTAESFAAIISAAAG